MINKNTTKNKNIVKNKKLAPFYKKFELFDETWKDIPKYDCVVKFMLQPTPELLDFHRRTHKARIELNRYVYKELKNGKEVPQQFHNWLKDNNIKNILIKYGFEKSYHQRGIIYGIHDAYKAYIERNDKQCTKRPCNFKEYGAIRIKEKGVVKSINSHIITMTNGNNHSFDVKYRIIKGMKKNKNYVSIDGGNIIPPKNKFDKKEWCLSLRARVPFKWKYVPTSSIGIDINKRKDVSVVFSDSTIINFDDEVLSTLSSIKDINKLINNTDKSGENALSTKERKVARLTWKRLQKKLRSQLLKLSDNILNKIEKNQQLLCLDSVTSGSKNGEFGQLLIKTLEEKARKRQIPFIKVPTPYTSQRCNKCGYTNIANRINKDRSKFICQKCGNVDDADANASKNILCFGEYIWDHGIYDFLEKRGKSQPNVDYYIKL